MNFVETEAYLEAKDKYIVKIVSKNSLTAIIVVSKGTNRNKLLKKSKPMNILAHKFSYYTNSFI